MNTLNQAVTSIIDHARRIHVQDITWSVYELVTEFHPDNTGTIIVPEDQREWAWKGRKGMKKMHTLIDSVVYNYPIPSAIFNKRSHSRYEIYDGRHRIETLWRFYNNRFKWNGYYYSELVEEDKRIFRERSLPVTIVRDATNEQLAETFIRLNSGAALKDYDLLWARRHSSLVSTTRRLVCRNERLSACLGGQDLGVKNDLGNWVALVAGLTTQNAGNMTTSFLRLSGDSGLGLELEIQENRVVAGLDALCALLEAANIAYPALPKQQKELKKVGKVAAYFLHEWMEATEDMKAGVNAKWLDVIGRLRGNTDTKKAILAALSTTGAQNLTATRISEVIAQVDAYLTGGSVPSPVAVEDDDDEDLDDDSD